MFKKEHFCINEILSIHTELPDYNIALPSLSDYSSKENFNCHELIIYTHGEGIYSIENKDFTLKKGNVLFIPKGYSKSKYTVNFIKPTGYVVIYFLCGDITITEPTKFNFDSEQLINLFLKAEKIWHNKKENYYSVSMSVLYEIISLMQTNQGTYTSSKKDNQLKPALIYMYENFHKNDFDVKKMANTTNLSYSYFKRIFIQKFSCPPIKYVNNLRINLARDYIATSNYTMTQISERCGFNDLYHFSKNFKNVVGVSPSQYKKSILKNI